MHTELNDWLKAQQQDRQDNNACGVTATQTKVTACGMTIDEILDTPMATIRATKSYDDLNAILITLRQEIDAVHLNLLHRHS